MITVKLTLTDDGQKCPLASVGAEDGFEPGTMTATELREKVLGWMVSAVIKSATLGGMVKP